MGFSILALIISLNASPYFKAGLNTGLSFNGTSNNTIEFNYYLVSGLDKYVEAGGDSYKIASR